MERIKKAKSWFFESTDKIHKLLARLTKINEKPQINVIINWKGDNHRYSRDSKIRLAWAIYANKFEAHFPRKK